MTRRKSFERDANPIPQLTDEHKRWIANLQKDYPDLPVGYARALVELYLSKPQLFTKENVDQWAKEKPQLMQGSNGVVRVLSPEEAADFESQLPPAKAHVALADIASVDNVDTSSFFEVTDRTETDGDEVQP